MPNPFSERKRALDFLKALRQSVGKKKSAAQQNITCKHCKAEHELSALADAMYVCSQCGAHLYIPAKERLLKLFDGGQFEERFTEIAPRDVLGFPGYSKKLAEQVSRSGLSEACLCVTGKIGGFGAVCAAIDIKFMMGSMGTAVGEKITLAAELAQSERLPLIIFSAGGGARMQEGIYSLMQMIKTSAAIRRFSDAGGLFISYVTNPTTGGITASFASLGDIIIAEPGALFGFAGPRVIEQTIGEKLPEGFQRSEFQLEHGFVDAIVPRKEMRATLARLLMLHSGGAAL
ncbi:MAG: acetyl-CoA carboxylase, carboxyltransferase subunit beta [Oscillospiraceae bacterium]|jgi:acetyl-CoA carboxylase carboxyl transferase subunit beta|nr:acetyl-CoA carboxylase, carboxyltransferase subunit beta [Oscillospiraceae bacterium]